MNTLNLPGLRLKALQKLKQHGYVGFNELEAMLVGYSLNTQFQNTEHPLLSAADFEISVLKVGKWEFLISWLSPYHHASEFPQMMGQLAVYLLGIEPIPNEVKKQLEEHRPSRQ